jgi:dTDP-4-amino-4,6-dideoxygalactose transaminase
MPFCEIEKNRLEISPEFQRNIPYVDLSSQYDAEKLKINECILRVLESGQYVGGAHISQKFEEAISKYCHVDHALAVSSGTDALYLALKILNIGPGDEVITVPNTYCATVAAICLVGATPVFVDVQSDRNMDPKKLEAVITKKSKAILPVHLTGRVCDMDPILKIAGEENLAVIEDAAQAVGAKYKGKIAGTFGDVAAFSAHPLKNLCAIGDAGYMLIKDGGLVERAGQLRNHGLQDRDTVLEWSGVARIDALQAEILHFRLTQLDDLIKMRQRNAKLYDQHIIEKNIFKPVTRDYEFNTYHTYVIQVENREQLTSYLKSNGVEAVIHYPVPLHLQPAAESLAYKVGAFPVAEDQAKKILSLPIHQYLKEDDIIYISNLINKFYN